MCGNTERELPAYSFEYRRQRADLTERGDERRDEPGGRRRDAGAWRGDLATRRHDVARRQGAGIAQSPWFALRPPVSHITVEGSDRYGKCATRPSDRTAGLTTGTGQPPTAGKPEVP